MVRVAFLILFVSGCSYDASFRDCEIECTNETGCPNGFECRVEGLCRLMGETQTCEAVLGDAGLDIDAPVTDALSTDAPLDAFACTAHGQCSAMTSGTCCVNPGPSGYCTPGVIIATACSPT